MQVTFRILGEVEATTDERRLDVGHARQRCVLACLLVDVNRPVSPDQLIDRVWADAPPHKARNAVAAYISRLRRLFTGVDGVQILHGPGGYTLHAPRHSVDLHRFRDLAAAARSASTPAESADLYETALQLWDGEPLSSLDTPWAVEVRSSLATERLSVTLDRNDAALRAGRHGALLGELVAAHRSQPLDERTTGQLMLAYFRSGRQADALEVYRATRERLVDELGVDPGPSLRAVYQQILEGDPEHPVAAPAAPVPESAPPADPARPGRHGVPHRLTRLIGREADLSRVTATLEAGRVVTLTGVGGVGKTRLAQEIADREHERFADGARICELAPLGDGAAVGQAVTAALRLPAMQADTIDDAVIAFLRDKELLLVVDNCEHVLVDAAALVDRIAAHCPRVRILATSRESLSIPGERVVPLPPLTQDHALEMFAERAKASRPDFDLEGEPVGAVAEICRRLDGVPLAIELAAARMRAMSSLDVARRLDRLRLLSGGTRGAHPRQQSVTATIDWSYRLLSEPEQVLFSRLSVFAGGFDLDAAHAVGADEDATEDDTLDLLMGLVDKSMVTVRSTAAVTRYDVLETLRAYGRERLHDQGSAELIASRHAHYYTDLVERVEAGLHSADEKDWVDRMAPAARTTVTVPDFDNVRAAFEHGMTRHDFDLVLRLVTSLIDLMNRGGYHIATWVYRAVEAADPGHPRYRAAAGVAARSAWVCGEFARARAFAAPVTGEPPDLDICYLAYPEDVIADTAYYTGDLDAAVAHYEAAQASADLLDTCHGGRMRRVLIADKLAWCHQASGTPDVALPAAESAMKAAEATANPTMRALARCALGRALSGIDPGRASSLFDEAAELARPVENNWLIGVAGAEKAAIEAVHGDPVAAARSFIDVLNLWERGAPGIIAQQWDLLGQVARLLVRLGAGRDAVALHRGLVRAGRRPPLDAAQVAQLGGATDLASVDGVLVDFARKALQCFC